MQKKKIILSIIGDSLKQYGFNYIKDKAYADPKSWGFSRNKGNITQRIIIVESRFEKIVRADFETTAYKSERIEAARLIPGFPERMIHSSRMEMSAQQRLQHAVELATDTPYHVNNAGYWPYETAEEFKRILAELLDIILKYGLTKLDELSVEDEAIPTDEMGRKLFASYHELSEKFISKHTIQAGQRNIDEWFRLIEETNRATAQLPYERVQDMLVETAAFLGEQLRSELGGKWTQGVRERILFIWGMNVYILNSYSVLEKVIDTWKNQSVDFERKEYQLILDGKLPMTESDMIVYQGRIQALHERK